jgi:nucleotide-binding universal stress UspA family protein
MFKTILVPIDLSDEHSWKKALPAAAALCQTFKASLHLLTVVPDFGLPIVGQYFPESYEQTVREQAGKQLEDFAAANVPKGIGVQCQIVEGKIYQEILETAEALSADLIVMGSHRPELRDFLLGPNAAKVVRHATCSVMVVRETAARSG